MRVNESFFCDIVYKRVLVILILFLLEGHRFGGVPFCMGRKGGRNETAVMAWQRRGRAKREAQGHVA